MMDKMILGRYIPSNSWLHLADPRAKLTSVMAFIIIVFFANNWLTYGFLFLFVLSLVVLSKVPVIFFFKRASADFLSDHPDLITAIIFYARRAHARFLWIYSYHDIRA
nr:energy-coupling factor transporter transmembrane protein EcfT [Listeria grayi]